MLNKSHVKKKILMEFTYLMKKKNRLLKSTSVSIVILCLKNLVHWEDIHLEFTKDS